MADDHDNLTWSDLTSIYSGGKSLSARPRLASIANIRWYASSPPDRFSILPDAMILMGVSGGLDLNF